MATCKGSTPYEIKRQRVRWLEKHKLTLWQFAEKTGQDFGTAYIWFRTGRTPRRLYLKAVLDVFPDWPHNA